MLGLGMFIRPLRLLWIPLALFLVWQGYVFLRPDPPAWSPAEIMAARRAVDELVVRLERLAPRQARFGVAHLAGDPHDIATRALKAAIAARDGWTVQQGSVIRKFLRDVSEAVLDATTLEEIVNAGKRVELDILVTGRVADLPPRPRTPGREPPPPSPPWRRASTTCAAASTCCAKPSSPAPDRRKSTPAAPGWAPSSAGLPGWPSSSCCPV